MQKNNINKNMKSIRMNYSTFRTILKEETERAKKEIKLDGSVVVKTSKGAYKTTARQLAEEIARMIELHEVKSKTSKEDEDGDKEILLDEDYFDDGFYDDEDDDDIFGDDITSDWEIDSELDDNLTTDFDDEIALDDEDMIDMKASRLAQRPRKRRDN